MARLVPLLAALLMLVPPGLCVCQFGFDCHTDARHAAEQHQCPCDCEHEDDGGDRAPCSSCCSPADPVEQVRTVAPDAPVVDPPVPPVGVHAFVEATPPRVTAVVPLRAGPDPPAYLSHCALLI